VRPRHPHDVVDRGGDAAIPREGPLARDARDGRTAGRGKGGRRAPHARGRPLHEVPEARLRVRDPRQRASRLRESRVRPGLRPRQRGLGRHHHLRKRGARRVSPHDRRSDRHRGPDGPRPPDDRRPGEQSRRPGGGDGGIHPRRDETQHHPGRGEAPAHRAFLQGRSPQAPSRGDRPHRESGGGRRGGDPAAGRPGDRRHAGDLQRPRGDEARRRRALFSFREEHTR